MEVKHRAARKRRIEHTPSSTPRTASDLRFDPAHRAEKRAHAPAVQSRTLGLRRHDAAFTSRLRVCSKINSDFAGGCLAVWLGAGDEHNPSGVCKERATTPDSQTAPALRGGAAPGHLLRCSSVTAHWRGCSWCPCGSTSRLASGQAALTPKSEVIFEQTLTESPFLQIIFVQPQVMS